MSISKITKNFATKRGLELTEEIIIKDDKEVNEIWVWEYSNDDEPILTIKDYQNESYAPITNIYMTNENYKLLPSYIIGEKQLRVVINKISKLID